MYDIKGIDCELMESAYLNVAAILNGIPLEQYQLFLHGGVMHDENGFIDNRGNVSVDFINRLSDRRICCIWEISLYIFPKGITPRPLYNYTDFLESNCECSIEYFDAGYLTVYVRNPDWKDLIVTNVLKMQPERYTIIK